MLQYLILAGLIVAGYFFISLWFKEHKPIPTSEILAETKSQQAKKKKKVAPTYEKKAEAVKVEDVRTGTIEEEQPMVLSVMRTQTQENEPAAEKPAVAAEKPVDQKNETVPSGFTQVTKKKKTTKKEAAATSTTPEVPKKEHKKKEPKEKSPKPEPAAKKPREHKEKKTRSPKPEPAAPVADAGTTTTSEPAEQPTPTYQSEDDFWTNKPVLKPPKPVREKREYKPKGEKPEGEKREGSSKKEQHSAKEDDKKEAPGKLTEEKILEKIKKKEKKEVKTIPATVILPKSAPTTTKTWTVAPVEVAEHHAPEASAGASVGFFPKLGDKAKTQKPRTPKPNKTLDAEEGSAEDNIEFVGDQNDSETTPSKDKNKKKRGRHAPESHKREAEEQFEMIVEAPDDKRPRTVEEVAAPTSEESSAQSAFSSEPATAEQHTEQDPILQTETPAPVTQQPEVTSS